MKKLFSYPHRFALETGGALDALEIAYHTYGELNAAKDNVIWVCHALTANSDVLSWWPGVTGEGTAVDPSKYFIVCANIIGSPYGSTSPNDLHFPLVTIRDMVQAHILLRKHLGIESIALLMGGSMGGYQVLEWALTEPDVIKNLFLIATTPKESPWGIAIHTSQRMAIEADPVKGLATARAIGILTYRSYDAFTKTQSESDENKTSDFKAESYMRYQGDKLVNRFTAPAYYALTRSMDSHNIARARAASVELALQQIQQPTLIIGITSDQLCPISAQRTMAAHMPNNVFYEVDSDYGHDGFLIEAKQINEKLLHFINDRNI